LELPQGSTQLALKDEVDSLTETRTFTLFYMIFSSFLGALYAFFICFKICESRSQNINNSHNFEGRSPKFNLELPQGSVQLALKDEVDSLTGTRTFTLFYKLGNGLN